MMSGDPTSFMPRWQKWMIGKFPWLVVGVILLVAPGGLLYFYFTTPASQRTGDAGEMASRHIAHFAPQLVFFMVLALYMLAVNPFTSRRQLKPQFQDNSIAAIGWWFAWLVSVTAVVLINLLPRPGGWLWLLLVIPWACVFLCGGAYVSHLSPRFRSDLVTK
jgi:hypothetical protein